MQKGSLFQSGGLKTLHNILTNESAYEVPLCNRCRTYPCKNLSFLTDYHLLDKSRYCPPSVNLHASEPKNNFDEIIPLSLVLVYHMLLRPVPIHSP